MWPRTIKKGNASVKLYRVKHPTNKSGWAYVLAWNTPEGRKTQKFAAESDAVDEANLKAKNLNAGRLEAADMTAEDRQELLAAREIVGDVPLLAALREWKAAKDKATPAAGVTVKEAVTQFYANKKALGVDTTAGYDRTLPAFQEHFRDRVFGSIELTELEAYFATFAHPVSRNSHRQRIVTLFRWARKRGLLPLDTLTAAERTETARGPRRRGGPWVWVQAWRRPPASRRRLEPLQGQTGQAQGRRRCLRTSCRKAPPTRRS
jgi:hypothetical protein